MMATPRNCLRKKIRHSTKTAEERKDVLPWPPPLESASSSLALRQPPLLQQQQQQQHYGLPFPILNSLPFPAYNTSAKTIIGDQSSISSVHKKLDSLFPTGATATTCTSFHVPSLAFRSMLHGSSPSDDEFRTIYPSTSLSISSFQPQSLPQSQPPQLLPPLSSKAALGPPPIGVFWDIENSQVPKGKSALVVVQRIRERFFSRFQEAEFVCVCDIRKESPTVIQELNDSQVTVIHVSGNSKNAADDKLRQAMRRFADVHASSTFQHTTVLLISGDINFATDLSDLRYRKRLYVILLHNKHAPDALVMCAHEHYDFHSLLLDIPNRPVNELGESEETVIPLKGGSIPVDVTVCDLPLTKNVPKIKLRLKKLSDNCGGKVMSVEGQWAIVRFPNKESALRAQKRMNGEDVFGSKIRVLYPQTPQTLDYCQQQQQQIVPMLHQPGHYMGTMNGAMMMPAAGISTPSSNHTSATYPTNTNTTPRRRSGGKRLQASSEQNSQVDLSALKKEVAALLQDVPNHTLPLFKFREMFERRYRRSISSYDLYRMRDVVYISESSSSNSSGSGSSSSSSGRNITLCSDWIHKGDDVTLFCKTHPPKKSGLDQSRTGWAEQEVCPAMPIVVIDLKTLSTRVHSMLQSHAGELPLVSFLDCYESEFGEIELADEGNGVPLEHLITCVQGVEIGLSETGMKKVQWSEKKNPDAHTLGYGQPLTLQMHQLSREFIDLLKTFPRTCLAFAKVIPAYHHHFGRQCRVADYGHLSLSSLLQTLQNTIQIMGENNNRVLTLSHRAQMKRFTTDMLRVLKAQGGIRRQIRVEDFTTAFYQVFPARPFTPEDYGLCSLDDLITELVENSSLVILMKDEEGKNMLAIPKREQSAQEIHRTRIFATEVYDLLRHSIRCEIPFSKFIPSYHHHFGRQCRVSDYGFSKLAELFEAIPDTVIAVNPNGVSSQDCNIEDKIIRLTPREQLKVVGEQLWSLIKKREMESLTTGLHDLDELYLKEYGFLLRPDYCGADNLKDLVENKLGQFLQVDGDKIVLVDRVQVEQLVQEAKSILENQPDCTMNLDQFIEIFNDRFPKKIDLATIKRDLAHMIYVSEDENGKTVISFAPLRVFARDIVTILEETCGFLHVSNFDAAYLQKMGRPLRPAQMGYSSVTALLEAIPDVVSIMGNHRTKRVIVLNKISAAIEELTSRQHVPPTKSKSTGHFSNNNNNNNANNNHSNSYHGNHSLNNHQQQQYNQNYSSNIGNGNGIKGKQFGQENHSNNNFQSHNGANNNALNANGNSTRVEPGSRWSPKWQQHSAATIPPHQPSLYSPCQSPSYIPRPAATTSALGVENTNIFSFDRSGPISPPAYDMWMRDAGAGNSPPVSPPMVWTYHPLVYPQPQSAATTPSNVMMPTHISFGNGPWSPPPGQMMMFEHRLPTSSMSVPASNYDGNNPAGQGHVTNAFQRLRLNSSEER